MSRHLIAFTAAIALAGCSAGMTADAVQEAYMPPEDATLTHQLDGPPPIVAAPEAPIVLPRLDAPTTAPATGPARTSPLRVPPARVSASA